MKSSKSRPFIIEVTVPPGQKPDLSSIHRLFKGTHVALDAEYGVVRVNVKCGRYVVRGNVTPEDREKAEQLSGVRFFADMPIQ